MMKENGATAIKGGLIITPFQRIENGVILIERGEIKAVGEERRVEIPSEARVIDARGKTVVPGFIDIHGHGGGGNDTLDGTYEAINNIAEFKAENGTTGFLPTTVTAPQDKLLNSARAVREAIEKGTGGAEALGIHLEGPYLNVEKKGAQNEKYIRKPSLEELDEIIEASDGSVKIVTLAPEVEGSIEFIKGVCQRGIVASAGHTNATYEEVVSAVKAGLSHICHTYSAMREFHHREPGVVGAVLSRDELTAELIADGLHVHPAAIELLIKCKGVDKVILVTDAVVGAGIPEGEYELGGKTIIIKKERHEYVLIGRRIVIEAGLSRFPDGTIAGSVLTMNTAVRNVANFVGLPLQDAVKMATVNPARRIGVYERKGSLEAGKDADVAVVDDKLNVYMTMVKGRIVYEKR